MRISNDILGEMSLVTSHKIMVSMTGQAAGPADTQSCYGVPAGRWSSCCAEHSSIMPLNFALLACPLQAAGPSYLNFGEGNRL